MISSNLWHTIKVQPSMVISCSTDRALAWLITFNVNRHNEFSRMKPRPDDRTTCSETAYSSDNWQISAQSHPFRWMLATTAHKWHNDPHRTNRVSPTHSNCACWWMVSTATSASDHTHNSILGTTSVNQRNNNNYQSCMNNWKRARFKRSMLMSSIKYAQCAGYISSCPRTLANVL